MFPIVYLPVVYPWISHRGSLPAFRTGLGSYICFDPGNCHYILFLIKVLKSQKKDVWTSSGEVFVLFWELISSYQHLIPLNLLSQLRNSQFKKILIDKTNTENLGKPKDLSLKHRTHEKSDVIA